MYSTYRVAQHDHISSREHAWLKSCKAQDCTSLCPYKNYHPRVLSHLPLFASSPICPLGAAAEILATITSSRNRNKFCVPEDIRQMASEAAKSRDPVRGRHLRKIAQKARREFEAVESGVTQREGSRPVVTKLWVNGHASCEGCLVVGCDHGPQEEVAQGVGPGPLVER